VKVGAWIGGRLYHIIAGVNIWEGIELTVK
jgi:hypothetical protein